MARPPVATPPEAALVRPRLGFLGVGWIGRHRMQAILEAGMAEVAAIADPSPETAAEAGRLAPGAALVATLDDLLDTGVDGVVIATPSALHAEQSIRALGRGAAVFCQKPLGRTAVEVRGVVDAGARGRPASWTWISPTASRRGCAASRGGPLRELGRVYAADLGLPQRLRARTSPGSTTPRSRAAGA
jgi:hypothetical protein